MDPEKCSEDVYTKGIGVGVYAFDKETAEKLCADLTAATGLRFDWHFAGGRAVIKVLMPVAPESVRKAVGLCDDINKITTALKSLMDNISSTPSKKG